MMPMPDRPLSLLSRFNDRGEVRGRVLETLKVERRLWTSDEGLRRGPAECPR